jgi:hypothetical protein
MIQPFVSIHALELQIACVLSVKNEISEPRLIGFNVGQQGGA